ncbi:MAG: DNA-binding response regulator [Arcobacter sp.]|nr:MAG: DNA-binding response regulator [Arcobacter sp.]
MKILLLEDDPILNEIIEEFLLSINHNVVPIYNGQEALERIYEESFQLLLLDVNVPSLNGFDLLKSLKQNKIDIPTIFITSLHTPRDLEEGFRVGADDYIKKPFQLSELNLRINNISRLRKIDNLGFVRINDFITYNYDTKLLVVNEADFTLSKIESKVLEFLIKNRNRTLSIEEISLNNWVYDEMPTATTIRTYIKNLRKILGKDMITNIKGIGYKLRD